MSMRKLCKLFSTLAISSLALATLGATAFTSSAFADGGSSGNANAPQDGSWGQLANQSPSGSTYSYDFNLSVPTGAVFTSLVGGGYVVTTQNQGVTTEWGTIAAPQAQDDVGR